MADETPETPADGGEAGKKAPGTGPTRNPLTKDSDMTPRPGFRSPANSRSKATKGKGRKGKKRR